MDLKYGQIIISGPIIGQIIIIISGLKIRYILINGPIIRQIIMSGSIIGSNNDQRVFDIVTRS